MKKLMIFLVTVFLITGCSYSEMKNDIELLKSARGTLFKEDRYINRKLTWLIYQNEIKSMKAKYPEDVKLIEPFLQKYVQINIKRCKTSFEPELYIKLKKELRYDICEHEFKYRFLFLIPMFEVSKNNHVYLWFDPSRYEHDHYYFIMVNKRKVSMIIIDSEEKRRSFYESMPDSSNEIWVVPPRHHILDSLK